MKINSFTLIALINVITVALLSGCVERYHPDDLYLKEGLLVRQYSLGPEGYKYWNEIGALRQGQGSMFDRQPALLKSNIYNIADESEKVLGFFTMSGVQGI